MAAGSLARTAADAPRDVGAAPSTPSTSSQGRASSSSPTSGDRHLTVFLDAGHGGIDPGGVGETESGQTIYEEDETLPVELDTAKVLEAKGFTVVVSRTDNQLGGAAPVR